LAQSGPVCPYAGIANPNPTYADIGDPPNVGIWKALEHLPSECHVSLGSKALLTVSLAATFSHAGTVEDIATRLGAVSQTQGLKYWSTTNKNWRVLVESASALISADKNSTRKDFTAEEILSGQALYTAQNDTRSWGLNVFGANGTDWHYYSLAVIKDSTLPAPEKSLINRQAALYRYLTGQQPDGEPPLSP